MNALVIASADAGGTGSILIPPPYEIFYSVIVFLVIWAVMGKYLPKIYGILDQRQEEIEAGLSAADIAQEEAAIAARERRDLLREANEKARETREHAEQDGTRIIADARDKAVAEATRVSENAAKQLAAERHAAELSLQREIGALATELAEKIIGEQLKNRELSARVIDRFMDDLEADLDRETTGVNNS